MRRKRNWVRAMNCVFIVFLVFGCSRNQKIPPLQLGIWYWNSPFSISNSQSKELREIGISTLYVKTASFTTDGQKVLLKEPIQWDSSVSDSSGRDSSSGRVLSDSGSLSGGDSSGGDSSSGEDSQVKGFKIVLVITVDVGLRSHFRELSTSVLATGFASGFQTEIARATKAGITVSGVQIDFDCPTSLLGKYAKVVREVQNRLTFKGSFSVTALQTWLGSRGYDQLAKECDFIVPQFYEGRIGKTFENIQPIPDTENLKSGIEKASEPGKNVWIGLASYGHALVFDRDGQIAGIYHGLQPDQAFLLPALRYLDTIRLRNAGSKSWAGESLAVFQAVHPDINGRGLGLKIAFVIPSIRTLRQQWIAFMKDRTPQCAGVIFYRFPQPHDQMALSLQSIEAAIQNKASDLQFKVKYSEKSDPYSMLAPRSSAGSDAVRSVAKDCRASVESVGNEATQVSPQGFALVMRFNRRGLESAAKGDFDQAITGDIDSTGKFTATSPTDANSVMFLKYATVPVDKFKTGIVVTGSRDARAIAMDWIAIGSSGAISRGKLDLKRKR